MEEIRIEKKKQREEIAWECRTIDKDGGN